MTSTNEPAVCVVPDEPDLYPWIQTRRVHHPNAVGVLVEIASRQAMSYVADAVLYGLGKDPWLSISTRPAETLAAAWLQSGSASDAIVGYAQALSPQILETVPTWFEGLGVRPWMVFTTCGNEAAIHTKAATLGDRFGVDLTSPEELFSRFADTDVHSDPVVGAANHNLLPGLPRVDGIRFRTVCRQALDAADFERVDPIFVERVRTFRSELASTVGDEPRADHARRCAADALKATGDLEEFVLTARALQVAGLSESFFVDVDTTLMLGAAASLPRPGQAEPDGWWTALEQHRDPDPGAAAALYCAGVDVDAMCALTVGDVTVRCDPATVGVEIGGAMVDVTGGGARFVAALLALRLHSGASDHDALFSTHRADSVRPVFIYSLLRQRADLGVTVNWERRRRHSEPRVWLKRHGITISNLRGAP